ncbi:MAG: hypothetical protein VKL97_01030 [Cyanobacteriota bacterium]|nr:hypothetical protein [Cyanobacteriota bacterium]
MAPVSTSQIQTPDLKALLPWCASLFLVLYGVGVVNTLIPLDVSSPQWQLRTCEALINQSPLVLMGLSIAVGTHHWQPEAAATAHIVRWTRRAALPLTVAFALLIPLQGAASLQILQTASRNSNTLIAATNRNLEAARQQVNQASSTAELEAVISQLPAGFPSLAQLGSSLSTQQQRLGLVLDQLRGRSVLQVQRNRQQQQTLVLRNSLRLNLMAALLAGLFHQARPRRHQAQAMGKPRGLVWLQELLKQLQRGSRGRKRAISTDLSRYCEGGDSAGRG